MPLDDPNLGLDGGVDRPEVGLDAASAARQVFVDDDTPGSSSTPYGYCLGLVLPGYSNYFMTIDPIVTGKSGSQNPPTFMLKE